MTRARDLVSPVCIIPAAAAAAAAAAAGMHTYCRVGIVPLHARLAAMAPGSPTPKTLSAPMTPLQTLAVRCTCVEAPTVATSRKEWV
jgi:hypothetical protein